MTDTPPAQRQGRSDDAVSDEHRSDEGPPLRVLTDRLLATPRAFLRPEVVTEAVLRDGLELALPGPLDADGLAAVRGIASVGLPQRLAAHVASPPAHRAVTPPAARAARHPRRHRRRLALHHARQRRASAAVVR